MHYNHRIALLKQQLEKAKAEDNKPKIKELSDLILNLRFKADSYYINRWYSR